VDQLKWHEPRAYRRALFRESERRNPWDASKFAAGAFALILGLRVMAGLGRANPNLPGWLPTVGIALAVAVFAAFVLPWLISLVSISLVILSEKGINNNIIGRGATIYFWPWDRVACCSTSVTSVGGRSYRTFSLHDDQGDVLATFGLPETPTAEEIRDYLQRHGKELREGAAELDVGPDSSLR
jgi:hypothetical protein